MVYQVNTNVTALNVYNNLGVHQAKASNALAKISSGLKAAGGVDIASLGVANTFLVSSQGTQTAISQVQNAINTLRVADQIFAETIALAQTGLEVANRGLDVNADVSAVDTQLVQIAAGLTALTTETMFNGAVVLGTTLEVDVDSTAAAQLDVTPSSTGTVPSGTANVWDPADFTSFIEATIDDRAANAGNLAALQNVLMVLNSTATNELAGMAQAQDADIAIEMMNLTSANIMTEAATAMLAQSMQLPNSVLKLLQ